MKPSKEDILEKHYPDFDKESGWMFDGAVENVFKAMDEYYNEGVDDCIEVVKGFQKSLPLEMGISSPLRGRSASSTIQNILWQLNKLKKPLQ